MTAPEATQNGRHPSSSSEEIELIESTSAASVDATKNPFAAVLPEQSIARFKTIDLEYDAQLMNAPIAYKTWGRLNATGTNAMVICHALTGSSDVEDW